MTKLAMLWLAAAVCVSADAGAPGATLEGKWAVQVEATEATGGDGVRWQLAAISGTLTLEQSGAKITGSWQGRLPEPWKLTGREQDGKFELQTEVREIPVQRDGQPGTLARSWIFRGTAEGDTMTGTFTLIGGDGEPPSQPFTARR